MSVVLLVRHGQASWGATDYDRLSDTGERQSRVVGAALAARGVRPDVLIRGSMLRHRQTTDGILETSGWASAAVEEDAGWDEFDHQQMLRLHPTGLDEGVQQSREQFQHWFEAATRRWTGGEHAEDYPESFADFRVRVQDSLRRTAERVAAGGTAVVVTSAGPIAWAVASLLGGTDDWTRLNPVVVNTSLTKIVLGRRGATMVSFNDHGHLESPGADLITYR